MPILVRAGSPLGLNHRLELNFMTDQMRLLFRLFGVRFEDNGPKWWSDPHTFKAVLSALEAANLLNEFHTYGIEGDPRSLREIRTKGDLLAESTSWDARPYLLQNRSEDDLHLGFMFRPN